MLISTVLATAVLAAGCASGAATTSSAPAKSTKDLPTPAPAETTPGPSSTPLPTTWPSGQPIGQLVLVRAADKVRPLLESTYADWFSSIALQQPDGPLSSVRSALVIHRIPHPALDDAVRRLLPDVTVLFVDARYSEKQTRQFEDQVSFGYWKDRGLQINMLGCDDGVCTFGVDEPDKWRAAIQAEYGADRVVVVKEGPAVGL